MSKLYNDASLMMIPSSVKDGKLYSIFPQPKPLSGELVTNGTFEEDASWLKDSGWTINNGKATYDAVSNVQDIRQNIAFESGKNYKVTFDISDVDEVSGKKARFALWTISNASEVVFNYTELDNGSYVYYYTATNGSALVFVALNNANGGSFSIDNISVVEVDQVPADFTFSRGSNLAATRINEQGLIEKGRENLLLQSNQFDTTWTIHNTNRTSGQSGYDGSSDAWLLTKSASSGRIEQIISATGIVVKSIYVKSNESGWCQVLNGVGYAYYDLENGVVGSTGGDISSEIISVGNGWYRISLVTNGCSYFRLYPAEADNDKSGTSGSIYIQDAQLEVGLVATDYIESGATTGKAGVLEDLPRLNWGDCPSLLLEPSRQNLFTYSEYVEEWSSNNVGVTLEENAATSPEGTQNATKIKEDNSNGSHAVRDLAGPLLTSGEDYTFSFFAKKGERSIVALSNTVGVSNSTTCWFDLENGQVLTNTFNSASIEDFGNGWFRCIATDTADAADDYDTRIYPATADNQFSHQGVEGYGIFVYGLQLEQGSYATSYIPTHGTTVTRSGEICSNTNLSDLGITDEFTLFIDTNGALVDGVSLNSSGDLRWYTQSTNFYRFYKTSDFLWITTQIDVSDRTKIALRVRGLECKAFVDGVLHSTTTLTTPFISFNSLYRNTEAKLKDELNEITLFPTALSDNECINLTSI